MQKKTLWPYPEQNEADVINDGIDRDFEYPDYLFALLDTAEVQRMRGVLQTGFSFSLYPNLTHSRHVHLIGTAKRALQMWDAITTKVMQGKSSARINNRDIERYKAIIGASGILHDIGHSPFSHDLETLIYSYTGKSHEEVAADMVVGDYSLYQFYSEIEEDIVPKLLKERLVDVFKNIPSIPNVLAHYDIDAERVAQIIWKKRASERKIDDAIQERHFLRECIDSAVVDADKLDYLQRDRKNAGITDTGFEPEGIISSLGLIPWKDGIHIGVSTQDIEMITQLLTTRAYMYTQCYTPKTVLKRDAMIYEACKRALASLGEKAEKFGRKLYLLDDAQFQAFITAHSQDPIATQLFMQATYDRRRKYDIAYQIKSSDIPSPADKGENEYTKILRKLHSIQPTSENAYKEDIIRDSILEHVNSGRKKDQLKSHEIIVYFHNRKPRTFDDCLETFRLFIFDHQDPRDGEVYLASERIRAGLADEQLMHAFRTFCRHQISNYFLVLCPREYKEAVQKATETYIKKDLLPHLTLFQGGG